MTESSTPSPLESILGDVRRAIEARLYYPALVVALTIPEICVALTFDNSSFIKQKHYAGFVDKYTTPRELDLDGISCYRLRGGVIHRGNAAGHPLFGDTHVIFTIPESRSSIHALSIQSGDKISAIFDLIMFCTAMETAARRWFDENKNNPKVISSMPKLLSLRHDGMPPFIIGAPVIASEL